MVTTRKAHLPLDERQSSKRASHVWKEASVTSDQTIDVTGSRKKRYLQRVTAHYDRRRVFPFSRGGKRKYKLNDFTHTHTLQFTFGPKFPKGTFKQVARVWTALLCPRIPMSEFIGYLTLMHKPCRSNITACRCVVSIIYTS